MNKLENISKLQEEKQAFEAEIFHWKAEIIKSTNKVYRAKCLETIKRLENRISEIDRELNQISSPISSPYSIDAI